MLSGCRIDGEILSTFWDSFSGFVLEMIQRLREALVVLRTCSVVKTMYFFTPECGAKRRSGRPVVTKHNATSPNQSTTQKLLPNT